jgi:uncharacterized protein
LAHAVLSVCDHEARTMSERRYEGFVPGPHAIEGYGAGGFRFAGMSHRGSVLVLPSGIHAWDPTQASDLTPAAFSLLWAEPQGSIELLLIGSGTELVPVPSDLRKALAAHNIRSDPMSTGVAISTYNILLGERRRVAAALLAVP